MADDIGDPVKLAISQAKQQGYAQGFMDGISHLTDRAEVERLRKELAKNHVCYYSMMGPYCVVCRKNLPYGGKEE